MQATTNISALEEQQHSCEPQQRQLLLKVTGLLYPSIDHRNHTLKAEPYALKDKKTVFP